MPDHDREEAEVDPERLGQVAEGRVQRHPGHDPGQREREDDEEGDRLAPEEAVARDRERREPAEQDGDRRRAERRLQGDDERVAHPWVVDRPTEPLGRQPFDRPDERATGVERVEADHEQRHVDERQRQTRQTAQEPGAGTRRRHRFSNAPARRASSR